NYGGLTRVSVTSPLDQGNYTGDPNAVRVTITQKVKTFISSLFLGQPEVTIYVAATATTREVGPACVLSLVGTLTLSGSSTVNVPGCVLASNSRNEPSLNANLNGNPDTKSVTAAALYGVGTVNATGNIDAAVMGNQVTPLSDPFKDRMPVVNPTCSGTGIQAKSLNDSIASSTTANPLTFGTGDTINPNNICGGNGNPYSSNPQNSITVGVGQALNLRPGTYIFYNTSLNVQGTLTCAGCTLVFAGDKPGIIDVTSDATVQISAPTVGDFVDVLIYRVAEDPVPQNPHVSKLNGNSQSYFTGGIYMPTGELIFNGTSTSEVQCTPIVAHTITFSGTNNTVGGCASNNPFVQRVRIVRLVE
ncbi:MAG: hypothetical protein ACM3W4_07260, partial [Ignavibacteriales bacterium]